MPPKSLTRDARPTLHTPPGLLGAALLFWGWETGFLLLGAVLAALLEGSRLARTRWEVSEAEFSQLWSLTTLLFLAAGVLAFVRNDGAGAVSGFLQGQSFGERSKALDQGARVANRFIQWLPLVFFVFAAAQAWSQREKVDLSLFSLWLRRKKRLEPPARRPAWPSRGLNAAYPYFALTLIAACAANRPSLPFFAALCGLVAWALWPRRNRRFAAPLWVAAVAAAVGLGYLGALGVRHLQGWVENMPTDWMTRFARRRGDPKESRTALGQVGRMKLSGRIALRLETPTNQPPPPLLREASYNAYRAATWLGSTRSFSPVLPAAGETVYVLREESNSAPWVRLAASLPGGAGLLCLPTGVWRLDDLQAGEVQTNHLGALRVKEGPGLALFSARYSPSPTFDSPPTAEEDLAAPATEVPALTQIAAELRLPAPTLEETVRRVSAWFLDRFEYSLVLTDEHRAGTNETALSRFLLRQRSGHCEYFATATTLLLRQAGIPARYAVGYSVQEKAGENRYVVRERHAHAWCLYYDEGARTWRDLDTTPGSWFAAEARRARFWEPLTDAGSRLWFEFQKLRYGRTALRQYLLGAVLLALAVPAFRFVRGWRGRRAARRPSPARLEPPDRSGLDSEFFLIERALAERGLERRPGETLSAWLTRIAPAAGEAVRVPRALLPLHYRCRFDPAGTPPAERARLRSEARQWLAARPAPTRTP